MIMITLWPNNWFLRYPVLLFKKAWVLAPLWSVLVHNYLLSGFLSSLWYINVHSETSRKTQQNICERVAFILLAWWEGKKPYFIQHCLIHHQMLYENKMLGDKRKKWFSDIHSKNIMLRKSLMYQVPDITHKTECFNHRYLANLLIKFCLSCMKSLAEFW